LRWFPTPELLWYTHALWSNWLSDVGAFGTIETISFLGENCQSFCMFQFLQRELSLN
jgi:hypothetical protein